jgi:spermidine synthase
MSSAIAAESFTAIVAFGPPTVAMGALFSHLNNSAHQAGMSFGRALGANTLGAAFAPLVFGVLALPTLGPKFALLSIAAGYLLLSSWRHWRVPFFLAPPILVAATALAIAIWAPPLVFIDVPEGGHVVSYQQGIMAAVSVIEDADDVATLRIDNRQQEGSSATRRVDARQALLPILLHPTPRRVLFLGLGTGVTAASATADPALEVDAVELLPEVIAASNYFRGAAQSRLNVITADARRFVRASSSVYDVIVSDNFHPARSGSGSLYTVEHFEAVRVRLSTGGIFCQWLPLHQLDLDTFRSITKSFLSVYPQASALIASNSLETPVIGLIGQRDVVRIDVDAVRAHLARVTTINGLTDIGIEDEFALLGSFIAGPAALDRFAGDADINTDDRPIVAYRAPRITYAPDSRPRDRLIALLQASFVRPEDIVSPLTDNASQSRLAAYWLARNQFIEAGRDIVPSHDARQMLAQVHEPLLSVLRISPDFRPAYDPLLRIAVALAQTDVDSSRALLSELSLSQPSRPEANAALNQLVQTR